MLLCQVNLFCVPCGGICAIGLLYHSKVIATELLIYRLIQLSWMQSMLTSKLHM